MSQSTNQKGISSILIVVLVLVVFGAVVILVLPKPSNSELPGWFNSYKTDQSGQKSQTPQLSPVPQATIIPNSAQKVNTFTSFAHGYSLSFPDSWKYTQTDEMLSVNQNVELEADGMSLKVYVNQLGFSTSKKTFEMFDRDFTRSIGTSYVDDNVGSKHTKIKNLKIDGFDALLMTEHFTYEGEIFYDHYQVKLNPMTTLLISFQANKQLTLNKNTAVIDQILNSIKILPRSAPVTDLKTYENKKYGFSFKYPVNWMVLDNLDDQNMPQVTLRDPDGLGRFALSLGGGNYTDRCEDVNLDESFLIGEQSVTLKDYCGKEDYFVQSQDGTKFTLFTVAWGLVAEDTIKEVLKSVIGVKVMQQ